MDHSNQLMKNQAKVSLIKDLIRKLRQVREGEIKIREERQMEKLISRIN